MLQASLNHSEFSARHTVEYSHHFEFHDSGYVLKDLLISIGRLCLKQVPNWFLWFCFAFACCCWFSYSSYIIMVLIQNLEFENNFKTLLILKLFNHSLDKKISWKKFNCNIVGFTRLRTFPDAAPSWKKHKTSLAMTTIGHSYRWFEYFLNVVMIKVLNYWNRGHNNGILSLIISYAYVSPYKRCLTWSALKI